MVQILNPKSKSGFVFQNKCLKCVILKVKPLVFMFSQAVLLPLCPISPVCCYQFAVCKNCQYQCVRIQKLSQILGVHLFNTYSQNKQKFLNVAFEILQSKQINILDFYNSGIVLSGWCHVTSPSLMIIMTLFMVKSADYFDASL